MPRLQQIGSLGLVLGLLAGLAAGCQGTRLPNNPELQYGHRQEAAAEDRETLLMTPPDSTQAYFYYPADVFDEVIIRPAPFDATRPVEGQVVPVEVLVKGALPDGCTELHALEQQRSGHLIRVQLIMRRPRRDVCVTVVRPYRFYFTLEGDYEPGAYTLRINDIPFSFEVQPPPSKAG